MKPCSYTSRALRRIPKILQYSPQDWVKKEEIFQFYYSPVTIHLSLFTGTVHPLLFRATLSVVLVHDNPPLWYPLLFMTLFTPNFAYLRGVVPNVLGGFYKQNFSSDFSSFRTSLLREKTHLASNTTTTTTTTLFTTSLVILQTL